MPTYRAADLTLLPNLISLARIPLAAAFPFVARRPAAALAVLSTAALTDVLDGWLARRWGETTALGAVVDPIADKVFAITVMGTLLAQGKLPRWGVGALLTREILEAPLLAWVLLSPAARKARRSEARANLPGKLATVVQFGAVMTVIAVPRAAPRMLVLAGITGALAGISYWQRELDRASQADVDQSPSGST
jgi:CDP-diacylglycerol--glycerol-3-phosphate 3-phosphatidyltransferase/cardiolipin synthase